LKIVTIEKDDEQYSVFVDGKYAFGPMTKDEAESCKNRLDKLQRKPKPPGDDDGLEP